MDKIIVKGLKVFANHGVNKEETEMGQWFIVDLTLTFDMSEACVSDSVIDTVSYSDVIKTVRRALQEKTFSLLERAAQEVCDKLFARFLTVDYITLTLKKPDAPINADFEYVAVELERARVQ